MLLNNFKVNEVVVLLGNHKDKCERRIQLRRLCEDRRAVVRFGDALGRRLGVERREHHPLKSFKDLLKGILGVKPKK